MRSVPGRRLIERHATAIGLTAYAAAAILSVAAVASGVEAFLAAIFDAPTSVASKPLRSTAMQGTTNKTTGQTTGSLVLTQDNWADMLRDPAFWASRKAGGNGNKGGGTWKPFASSQPQPVRLNLGVFTPPNTTYNKPQRDDSGDGETFRTVCVRLCDGAFFPLSFSTTREHFDQDAAKCEKSCGASSRMFFYKNPGAEPEDMEDMEGRPYKKLTTAFLYKTQYVGQCKCKPHPWEEAALDRHRIYALEAAKSKGSKLADAPLKDLKAKVRQAELDARAEKKRLAQARVEDQRRAQAEAKAARLASKTAGTAKRGGQTVAAANLPPPPTLEPTALYQSPPAPQPSVLPKPIAKSVPPPTQTKSVPASSAQSKTWAPVGYQR